jgi:hypothetical protein
MNSVRLVPVVLFLFALISIRVPLAGQATTATLTGTVTDPSGNLVSGVVVIAAHVGTGIERSTTSNEAGVYNLPLLPIGVYFIRSEAKGFKTVTTNAVKLDVNQTARVNFNLELGDVTQRVEVQGIAPVLQTESPAVGALIPGTTTENLPLNGRNFQQLTLLIPGAIATDPNGFNSVGAIGRPYVNGHREQGNSFLLDGVAIDETIENRIGYRPNLDAIAEFKIETSNASAEFGNAAGAVINTATKSGTNAFHGNLFEFFRNDALDANRWANNRNSTPQVRIGKPKLRQSIWGGTLGGPIVRSRAFFFGAYQDTRQRTGGPSTATVLPQEWRRGDLSSIPATILDPQTGQPFPDNQIPVARFSPLAKALFADPVMYPLPTRAGATTYFGNYATTTVSAISAYQFDAKLDVKLESQGSLSGRYSFGDSNERNLRGTLPADITARRRSRSQNLAVTWNRAVGSGVFNEARIGFNRAFFINEPFDWAGIGNANARLGIPGGQLIAGLSGIFFGVGVGSPAPAEDNVTNTFHYSDTLSVATGRHFLKMGGQWQRYQQNRFYSGNNGLLGFFEYDGSFTGAPVADFLLDQLHRKGIGSRTGTWGHRQNRIGLFFQDDYKVRPSLTLNFGLRWEYVSPIVEVKNRQSNFDISTGRQLFAGQDGNSRALYSPYYGGFEPVLGFAWVPGVFERRVVIRGGYRITQFMEGTGSNLRLPLNPPFFSEADVLFDRSGGPGTAANGFTDVILRDQISGIIRIWDPHLRPQFTQQWNLSLQYQLGENTAVTAGYVGHRATHLIVPRDFNQPLPGSGPPSTWLPLNQRRPLYPYLPKVTQVSGTDSSGTSAYDSLQVDVRHRFGGLEFTGAYTLGKSLTDSLGFFGPAAVASPWNFWVNAYDRRGDRGLSAFDVRHNVVGSGTYSLPFGHGRKMGNSWRPIINAILGGWSVSNIVTLHSGFPVTVTQNPTPASNSLQDSRGGERPDRVPGRSGKLTDPTPQRWLDISAYTHHPLGVFGNAGNSTERAPGFANWDLAVSKRFALAESSEVDLRAEFFNFTNHPSFAPPYSNISDPNNFGRIFDTVSPPRTIEFVLKLRF